MQSEKRWPSTSHFFSYPAKVAATAPTTEESGQIGRFLGFPTPHEVVEGRRPPHHLPKNNSPPFSRWEPHTDTHTSASQISKCDPYFNKRARVHTITIMCTHTTSSARVQAGCTERPHGPLRRRLHKIHARRGRGRGARAPPPARPATNSLARLFLVHL